MNKSEMELQAIREKLQSLKADLPLEENHSLPWSPISLSSHLSYPSQEPTEEDDQNLAQIASTVETLKQRSNLHLQQFSNPGDSSPSTPPHPATEAQDRLFELNWQRLAAQAQRINQLSQTQETAILELKAIADQHCDGKIISVLEGGYDLTALARSACQHIKVLANVL